MKTPKGAKQQGPKAPELEEEEVMVSQPKSLQTERATEPKIGEALEKQLHQPPTMRMMTTTHKMSFTLPKKHHLGTHLWITWMSMP